VLKGNCPRLVVAGIMKRILFVDDEMIGASPAQIDAYLLDIWGLPLSVIEAVAHHRAPERRPESVFDVRAAASLGSRATL
jgi:HD-like signal output (HDOD) protein